MDQTLKNAGVFAIVATMTIGQRIVQDTNVVWHVGVIVHQALQHVKANTNINVPPDIMAHLQTEHLDAVYVQHGLVFIQILVKQHWHVVPQSGLVQAKSQVVMLPLAHIMMQQAHLKSVIIAHINNKIPHIFGVFFLFKFFCGGACQCVNAFIKFFASVTLDPDPVDFYVL